MRKFKVNIPFFDITSTHWYDARMVYLTILLAVYCFAYVALLYLFPIFFEQRMLAIRWRALRPLVIIVAMAIASYNLMYAIADPFWRNRFEHAFLGAVPMVAACFFAARASGVRIARLQFFIFSALVVTALGVANELLELTLQESTTMIFSTSITDTWLDLASNTVGIVIASLVLVPIFRPKKERE